MAAHAVEDLIIDDFEKKRGQWTFEGSAFTGYGGGNYWHPGRFDRGMLRTRGHRGYAMLKSWGQHGRNVDGETGRALSPAFKVERNFIRFLLSGGKAPGQTCVNLLVDEKVVRSATGANSNLLQAVAFDVVPFRGKEAQIEVVDRETGPWGHVCIDDLIQCDVSDGARLAKDKPTSGTDTVWTQQDRRVGNLHWSNGKLHLNGSPVQADAVKSIALKPTKHSQEASLGAVQFCNGETWRVEILTLKKGTLTLRGDLYGERAVDLSSVACLEFMPGAKGEANPRPGILYRSQGSPVPGKLKWIKKDDVAVDCALGILPLPRQGLVRYLIPGALIETDKGFVDEVGLVDGSVLFGKVSIEDEKVLLDHPVLDTLDIAWEKLHYLIRSGNETLWLTDLEERQAESSGPLGPQRGVEHLDFRRANKPSLSAVRVVPRTVLRYKLPSGAGNNSHILRTVLAPIPGSRGDATITLSVDGREFYRNELAAEDSPEKLSLPLPKGNELLVGVEFGERLAYPCGIELHDAHLAAATAAKEGGRP